MVVVILSVSESTYKCYGIFSLSIWQRGLSHLCFIVSYHLYCLPNCWLPMHKFWILIFHHFDYQAKIPDIEKCLDVVATLQAKKGTGEVGFLWFSTSPPLEHYSVITKHIYLLYLYLNDICNNMLSPQSCPIYADWTREKHVFFGTLAILLDSSLEFCS